jgi:hypothetical protein
MAKGGARRGSGRKSGSPNRRTAEIVSTALSEGVTPLEFMLKLMRDEDEDPKLRAWAAERAAPFIHPRPAPMARTVEIDLPDTSTAEGITKAMAAITKAAASGQIAPAEAQAMVAIVEAQRKAIETGEILERLERLEATAGK